MNLSEVKNSRTEKGDLHLQETIKCMVLNFNKSF